MLKYCFANGCPYDETTACPVAAGEGHIDCLRFLFDKVKPSRKTKQEAARAAAESGRLDILIYFVEERRIPDDTKINCASVMKGQLDCLKYMVEEAEVPLEYCVPLAYARYFERSERVNYLREKGCPEPTDEEYAEVVAIEQLQSV